MSVIKAKLLERERELWLDQVAKLSGKVAAGKVQPATLRAFYKVSPDRTFQINFNKDVDSISQAENLLGVNRLAQVFGLGLALCKVPLVGTTPQWALAKFISNPFDAELLTAEQNAANALFNARLKFHTQQADRFDQVLASRYMMATTEEATYSVKTLPMNANFLMVGGEENYIEFKLPLTGDFSTALLAPTTYAFYVVVQAETIMIAADEANTKDSIAAFLRA